MLDVQTIVIGNTIIVTALISGFWFFVRLWISTVNEKLRDIEKLITIKVDNGLCCERMKNYKEDLDNMGTRMREMERNQ